MRICLCLKSDIMHFIECNDNCSNTVNKETDVMKVIIVYFLP